MDKSNENEKIADGKNQVIISLLIKSNKRFIRLLVYMRYFCWPGVLAFIYLLSCQVTDKIESIDRKKTPIGSSACALEDRAKISAIEVNGSEQSYRFSVTIQSPDTGCDQYADWWEVITPDSLLIYRRILTHSHVSEQPFTRSGGPIEINDSLTLIVRAHMNNLGYGCEVYSGSIREGFVADTISRFYASGLAEEAPLPGGCAF